MLLNLFSIVIEYGKFCCTLCICNIFHIYYIPACWLILNFIFYSTIPLSTSNTEKYMFFSHNTYNSFTSFTNYMRTSDYTFVRKSLSYFEIILKEIDNQQFLLES